MAAGPEHATARPLESAGRGRGDRVDEMSAQRGRRIQSPDGHGSCSAVNAGKYSGRGGRAFPPRPTAMSRRQSRLGLGLAHEADGVGIRQVHQSTTCGRSRSGWLTMPRSRTARRRPWPSWGGAF